MIDGVAIETLNRDKKPVLSRHYRSHLGQGGVRSCENPISLSNLCIDNVDDLLPQGILNRVNEYAATIKKDVDPHTVMEVWVPDNVQKPTASEYVGIDIRYRYEDILSHSDPKDQSEPKEVIAHRSKGIRVIINRKDNSLYVFAAGKPQTLSQVDQSPSGNITHIEIQKKIYGWTLIQRLPSLRDEWDDVLKRAREYEDLKEVVGYFDERKVDQGKLDMLKASTGGHINSVQLPIESKR